MFPFLIMYSYGFPSRTLVRERIWITKLVAVLLGHFGVLFLCFFWVAFRTSKETDKFSLNKSKVFHYYF